jgi:glyoxylase I family protein
MMVVFFVLDKDDRLEMKFTYMNLKSLHHICIQTDVYAESLAFYRDTLGFKVVLENKNFRGRNFNAWLERDGFRIELQTGKNGASMNQWSADNQGPVHIAFVVDNAAEEYKALKDSGFSSFKKDTSGTELYVVKNISLFKMRAPEGTEIEIRDSVLIG